MNNITETRYTTPPLGGSAQNDSVQSQHDHPQIGAGALDPLRSPPSASAGSRP